MAQNPVVADNKDSIAELSASRRSLTDRANVVAAATTIANLWDVPLDSLKDVETESKIRLLKRKKTSVQRTPTSSFQAGCKGIYVLSD